MVFIVQQNQLFDESCDTMSEGIIDNKNQDGSLGAKEYIERHYLHEAFASHLISPIWLDLADYLITNKTINEEDIEAIKDIFIGPVKDVIRIAKEKDEENRF